MSEDKDLLSGLFEAAGMEFDVRIEDGVMLISPSEAGIMLFAFVSGKQEDEAGAWAEVDRMSKVVEEVRDENAVLRDLFEDLHPMLVDFGQKELADRMMEILYPIRGLNGGAE